MLTYLLDIMYTSLHITYTSVKTSTFLAISRFFFNKIRLLHTLLLYPGLNLPVRSLQHLKQGMFKKAGYNQDTQ